MLSTTDMLRKCRFADAHLWYANCNFRMAQLLLETGKPDVHSKRVITRGPITIRDSANCTV